MRRRPRAHLFGPISQVCPKPAQTHARAHTLSLGARARNAMLAQHFVRTLGGSIICPESFRHTKMDVHPQHWTHETLQPGLGQQLHPGGHLNQQQHPQTVVHHFQQPGASYAPASTYFAANSTGPTFQHYHEQSQQQQASYTQEGTRPRSTTTSTTTTTTTTDHNTYYNHRPAASCPPVHYSLPGVYSIDYAQQQHDNNNQHHLQDHHHQQVASNHYPQQLFALDEHQQQPQHHQYYSRGAPEVVKQQVVDAESKRLSAGKTCARLGSGSAPRQQQQQQQQSCGTASQRIDAGAKQAAAISKVAKSARQAATKPISRSKSGAASKSVATTTTIDGSTVTITRRKNATRETTATLKDWLDEHGQNPYPTKGEKIMLSIITKMSLTQVSTWFANARRRMKKENKVEWASGAAGQPHCLQSQSQQARPPGAGQTNSDGGGGGSRLNSAQVSSSSSLGIRYLIERHQKQQARERLEQVAAGANSSASSAPAAAEAAGQQQQQQHSAGQQCYTLLDGKKWQKANSSAVERHQNGF